MVRSIERPAGVGRPGKFGWVAVGMVVSALVGAPAQAQDAAAPAAPAAPAAQAEAPKNPFMFTSDASLLINYVKPDKTADFETVMGKVKEALAMSDKPERKAQAEGWKVFKTDLPGPSGAITYFAVVDPVIKGNDYNMRAILTEAFGVEATNGIYRTLADSVAGQQLVALTISTSMK